MILRGLLEETMETRTNELPPSLQHWSPIARLHPGTSVSEEHEGHCPALSAASGIDNVASVKGK